MSVFPPPHFELASRRGPQLTLRSPAGHVAHLFVLEPDIIRLLLLPNGQLRGPRTWAVAPGAEEVPTAGRDRFDLSGFGLPAYQVEEDAEELRLNTGVIRLRLRKSGLLCQWDVRHRGRFERVACDRKTQAYNLGFWDHRVYHYLQRHDDEKYFGLGECSGDLDRRGGRFRLCSQDAMGYNARTSDPLYKHIPFYLTWRAGSGASCGLFYDTLSDCSFDFGRELDNYHGPFRSFVAESGDLDLYFIAGEHIADIVRRYTWLTGRPAFMPGWSLGYSGSTMAYTDAPDAQRQLDSFLARCTEHDILCDSFHLSSGYTTRNGKRYVFTWDRDKFPDPSQLTARYRQHGVHLCANIKPCLLRDHPLFAAAAAEGLFITDGNDAGSPLLVQFWDEVGAYLDFTNPRAVAFWQQGIRQTLLQQGICATWNDNNEYEITTPRATLSAGSEQGQRAAIELKPLMPLLMMQASRQAQKAFAPTLRPFLVSRSGAAGMQRYAQTWSGDNYTSWETLRYNLRMGLGLALSGVSNSGHDVGGFAGPAPSPELFLRWLHCGIFLPRFSIHSWNSDGSVSEPWMYPELTPQVRELIRLRYRLLPYFYELAYRAHRDFEPMLRPTFYDFPEDPRCYEECDEAMLGPSLLIAPVVDPDRQQRTLYLPQGSTWRCFFSGQLYVGGSTVTLPAPLSQPILLVREGAVLPLNIAEQHFNQRAHEIAFALFPPAQDQVIHAEFFVDDGESEAYRQEGYGSYRIELQVSQHELIVKLQRQGPRVPPASPVTLLTPPSEMRAIRVLNAESQELPTTSISAPPHHGVRVWLGAERASEPI